MKEDKEKERGEVSRRDFLIGAGAVVVGGAIGAGITYPLVKGDGEVVTTTKLSTIPTTVTTTVGAETVTKTTTVAADTVTTTIPGTTITKTTTVAGDGAVEPWQEPEEKHYAKLMFH